MDGQHDDVEEWGQSQARGQIGLPEVATALQQKASPPIFSLSRSYHFHVHFKP